MFKQLFFRFWLIPISLMVSCVHLPGSSQLPAIETKPTPIVGMAVVQTVDIQILGYPQKTIDIIIRGQLPDAGCTTIAAVNQARAGNTFNLVLMTWTDPLALCAPALTPFEEMVSLEGSDLPPAKYIVNANGIEASFTLLPRDISIFKQQLVEALNSRDFETLKLMMNDSFMIAPWRSEGAVYTAEAAIEQLRLNYLNQTSSINPEPQMNLISLLGGVDPNSIPRPEVNITGALFVSGMGQEGKDEAILYVADQPDGSLYWHGFLIAPGGFAQSAQPADMTVHPTNVQYVSAEKDINIHSGPGSSFTIIGNLYAGQVAVVTGKNLDETWWHVACANNTAGDCWVSADRALTSPSTVGQASQPPPEPEKIPTITIVAVTQDDQVTIRTQNFPPDTKFSVRMGKIGTVGIDGILVETFNSKNGGSITATFDIPKKLHGEKQIAIRVESQAGYYSYNWFDNVTSGNTTSNPTEPQPTDIKYIVVKNDVEIYGGPGVKYGAIGSIEEGQVVKVTGISLDGKWWQVTCPNGKGSSCWVSTNPKFTRPIEEN